eukprot:7054111-Pyramimonas_sp.AAC.1
MAPRTGPGGCSTLRARDQDIGRLQTSMARWRWALCSWSTWDGRSWTSAAALLHRTRTRNPRPWRASDNP